LPGGKPPSPATLSDGREVTSELVRAEIADQKHKLKSTRIGEVAELFERMATHPDIPEFLTLEAL
jgi:hypothetical protein